MNPEMIKLLGRLGHRVSPKLIYFFLVYQIVGSLMILLLDSGFPLIIIIIGWIFLFLLILFRSISSSKIEHREEQKSQNEQYQMMQLISKIKKYLSRDPDFRTTCSSCGHYNSDNQTCKTSVPSWANPFKFHVQDEQNYCLYWGSRDEAEPGPSKFNSF